MSDKSETLDDICTRIRKIDESMMRDLDFMAAFLEFLPRDIESAAKRLSDAKYCEGWDNCEVTIKAEQKQSDPGNAAARKFDEAAFDKAVSKPNGWSDVADPVAEIRRMRDGDDPGNAAALREALERIRPLVRATGTTPYVPERKELVDGALAIIDAALAAPARNCDVGTAADALAAYTKDRDLALSPEAQDAIWWLFEKAEKEETK